VGGNEGKRERRRVEGEMGRGVGGEMGRGVGGKNGYERGKREGEWDLRKGRLRENRREAGGKKG
jgi:hypothetical protein